MTEFKHKFSEAAKNAVRSISPTALAAVLTLVFLSMISVAVIPAIAQSISLRSSYRHGDFKLVFRGKAAAIYVDAEDKKVVQIAANDLSKDVDRVTGANPQVVSDVASLSGEMVIAGTVGKNKLLAEMERAGRIDLSSIKGRWESYLIATVKDPLPRVRSALVIAGSDRRGTAFGLYELSQMIGVSPWNWWADVTPEHKESLIVSRGMKRGGEPSVRYRGIFLNDEDWGLQPWAAKTFEPETGDIGPKTYAKIFELLLRLKANTLWPAMHEVTRPFNSNPANAQIADDYAIVMGSSHAEPMLRNNVGEWKGNKDDYDFVQNPTGVTAYWEDRLKTNGRFENVYTIGMRGIHDSPIQGTKNQAERISLLEKIFAVQRSMLVKYTGKRPDEIPQIFCPYKEVLADYRAGLKVPDDVTIVFPDDNFGYIRQFPTEADRRRKGGFGVYYHISYLGRPMSYLWLNSTPPALIWEEMSKAYENGMRNFWILNIGDIKPAEVGLELFMQIAWDAKKWRADNIQEFLTEWVRREFGEKDHAAIAEIMDKYFRLGFQRRPEHLQWNLPTEPSMPSDLSLDETLARLQEYNSLRARTDELYERINPIKKDAFYELVVYPVRSAALANDRFFGAELANRFRTGYPARSRSWATFSANANSAIAEETKVFNEQLAGGKWRYIMSPEMNAGQWTSMRSKPPIIDPSEFGNSDGDPVIDSLAGGVTSDKGEPRGERKKNTFTTKDGSISIEPEHFTSRQNAGTFSWQIIHELGKTGDSVTVMPNTATTFSDPFTDSPVLEYRIQVDRTAEFLANFFLLPTQPIFTGTGLRIAFSIDGGTPQVVEVDSDMEVGSRKWSFNVLGESTSGLGKIQLSRGSHLLRVFAVDTGVVLDKIVLNSQPFEPTYFGPRETRTQMK